MKAALLVVMMCLAGLAYGRVGGGDIDVAATESAGGTAGLSTASVPVSPAPTNGTVITSDRLEYDFPRTLAIFTGNVLVRDEDMRMWADKMTVILTPESEIETVTAIGRVAIFQPERKAYCRKAIFLVDKNEVILTGKAVIHQGRDRVAGEVIHIWTDSDRMVSEPGHLVVFSDEQAVPTADR